MTQKINLIEQISVANTLGEGIIWDHRAQTLLWTDIQKSTLYSWRYGDKQATPYPCPERLGCFGLTTDSAWLICAFESGFALYHPVQQQVQWIAKIEQELTHTRMNDGRVDRQGRFWAGTMMEDEGKDETRTKGGLYRLESNGLVTKVINEVKVSNGLCWNPRGDTLYFADSPSRTIQQAKMDPISGTLSPLTFFASTKPTGFPDGSCVDSEGCIWNAEWASSTVKRYAPDGQLLLTLDVPCKQPSCVAFAGSNLDHLVVTSARQDLPAESLHQQPSNGDVFIYQTPYQGLAESICNMSPP